jgi:hypothetical protein
MAERMPALFIGHGNPMNALLVNPYTQRWAVIGAALPKPKAILSGVGSQLTTSAFTGTNPATEATAPGLRFILRVHNLRNGVRGRRAVAKSLV